MAKALDKSAALRAQAVFAEWYERTGDHRLAAQRAGVSERTGRRWRLRYAHPQPTPKNEAPKTNLKNETTRFIGRQAALSALRGLFTQGARIVTVLGPGGIGKTRLVSQYADVHAYDYARHAGGGVWLCDLSACKTMQDVCGAVAQTLGIPLASKQAEADVALHVGEAIAARGTVLLILDNFEQVVEHAPATVGRWTAIAGRAHFLITSRVQLRLAGEVSWQLESLALPPEGATDLETIAASETVQLFVDRARLVRPSYELTEQDARVLAKVVRQLDGLPLGIELAAARMAVLPAAEIQTRLAKRFELLVSTTRGVSTRQISMRTAIDWSWDLLSAVEKSALAQCAIFRTGFTIRAAESVLDLEDVPGAPPVLDVVQALAGKSLLRVLDQGEEGLRFGMYDSVRDYTAERLEESGRAEAVAARHAEYYVAIGEELSAKLDAEGGLARRRELGREIDNLVAVHQWALAQGRIQDALRAALALSPILHARGLIPTEHALLDAALSRATDAVDLTLRVRAFVARSNAWRVRGRLSEAMTDAEQALLLAKNAGDARLEALATGAIGAIHHSAGRIDDGQRAYEHALALARGSGDVALEGRMLGHLALSFRLRRRVEEALSYAEQALAVHKKLGNVRLEADALGTLGTLHQGQMRWTEARDCYERALEILREIGDRGIEASVLANLATLHHELGDLEQGRVLGERAIGILREMGVKRIEAGAIGNLAAIYAELGRLEHARKAYEQAIDMLREAGDTVHEGLYLSQLGAVQAMLGSIEEATATFGRAETILQPIADEPLYESVELQRAHLDLALSRQAAAAGDREASERYRGLVLEKLASVETHKAHVLRSDDVRIAIRMLRRALDHDMTTGGASSPSLSIPPPLGEELIIGDEAREFRVPGGRKVILERRRAVRLILLKLVQARQEQPGVALPLDALLAAGWPGERVLPQAGASRVYVALGTLRRLGLRGLLISRDGGYLLDPKTPLRIVSALD